MSKSDLFAALESAQNGNDILLILEAIEALYWLDKIQNKLTLSNSNSWLSKQSSMHLIFVKMVIRFFNS